MLPHLCQKMGGVSFLEITWVNSQHIFVFWIWVGKRKASVQETSNKRYFMPVTQWLATHRIWLKTLSLPACKAILKDERCSEH